VTPKVQPEGAVFGERLQELRKRRGETVRSLAALCGTSFTYISDMEHGRKVPSLTMLLRLSMALDCDIAELVSVFSGRDLRKLLGKRR